MAQNQYQKFQFRIISTSSEETEYPVQELITQSPQSKGWQSARFCDFPQEITLQFMQPINLKQIQFLSHQSKITSKIEIYVFFPDPSLPYQNQNIKYKKLGYLSLDSNERTGYQARELKSVYVDAPCQFMKLLLHKPHINKYNLFNQVGLIALSCFGEDLNAQVVGKRSQQGQHYNEIQFETQFDQQTLERLRELEQAKAYALQNEDYQDAKRIKETIERLKVIGVQLRQLDERKQIAIQNEDYDSASIIKQEMNRLRDAIAPFQSQSQNQNQQHSNSNMMGQYQQQQGGNYGDYGHHDQQNQYNMQQQMMQQDPGYQFQGPQVFNNNSQQQHQQQQQNQWGNQQQQWDQEQNNNQMNQQNEQQQWEMQNQGPQSYQQEQEMPNQSIHQSQHQSQQQLGQHQYQQQQQQQQTPFNENRDAHQQVNHDSQVLPAIRNQGKMQEDGGIQDNRDTEQQQNEAEPLSGQSIGLAQPLIPSLGESLCRMIFSKNRNFRLKSLEDLDDLTTKLSTDHNKLATFTSIIGAISNLIVDKNIQIGQKAMVVFESACLNYKDSLGSMKGDLNNYMHIILSALIEKVGDNQKRTQEGAEQALNTAATTQVVQLHTILMALAKDSSISKKLASSIKHIIGRLKLLDQFVCDPNVQQHDIPLEPMVELACRHISHPKEEVRNYSIALLTTLHASFGDGKIRPLLGSIPQQQMELLEESFGKGQFSKPQKQSQGVKSMGTGKQRGGNEEQNTQIETKINAGNSAKQGSKPVKKQQQQKQAISCEFCGVSSPEFSDTNKLDIHLWKECPMLFNCQHCAQVVEVQALGQHLLEECEYRNQFRQCSRCKEPISVKKFDKHMQEKTCIPGKSISIANRCCLCHQDIPQGQQGWIQHLVVDGCPNNEKTAI